MAGAVLAGALQCQRWRWRCSPPLTFSAFAVVLGFSPPFSLHWNFVTFRLGFGAVELDLFSVVSALLSVCGCSCIRSSACFGIGVEHVLWLGQCWQVPCSVSGGAGAVHHH